MYFYNCGVLDVSLMGYIFFKLSNMSDDVTVVTKLTITIIFYTYEFLHLNL